MKRWYVIYVLFIVILMSGCEKNSNIDVRINTISLASIQEYIIDDFSEPKLIRTFDDFSSVFNDGTDLESYDEDYFKKGSIYIIPLLSSKNPLFELDDFTISNGVLSINIIQSNRLQRSNSTLYESSYYVFVEIQSNDIEHVEYDFIQEDNYFDLYTFHQSGEPFIDTNSIILENIEDYKNVLGDIVDLGNVITDETFNEKFVVVYQAQVTREGYIEPVDVCIYENSLHIVVKEFGHSLIQYYDFHLFIYVLDKSDIDLGNTFVHVETIVIH